MMMSTTTSPIYDIAPPSRALSRRKRSRKQQQQLPIFRTLIALLSITACLLTVSTVYLFHLHHAHLQPTTSLQLDANSNSITHESPGGSATRHKLDVANFLLQRQLNVSRQQERDAQEESGWKGGSEENFIKIVNESTHHHNHDHTKKKESMKKNAEPPAKTTSTNNRDNNFLENIQNWTKLQLTLLKTRNNNSLLPHPIPRTHTSRGFSGLYTRGDDQPPSALQGAMRGTISCPDVIDPRINEVLSSMLAFWNEPRGTRDALAQYVYSDDNGEDTTPRLRKQREEHQHPFIPKPLLGKVDSQNLLQTIKSSRRRYLTFEPDGGGWNNMRIAFEVVVILAVVSGRTLVLPPEQVMYLLHPKKGDNRNGRRQYTDYYNLTNNLDLMRYVPIISAEEFLQLEGGGDGLISLSGYNTTWTEHLHEIAKSCEERKKSNVFCEDLYDHYASHGQLSPLTTHFKNSNCLVFDADVFLHGRDHIDKLSPDVQKRITQFCGKDRYPIYYNQSMHDAPVWHFETLDLRYRLLVHFYAILFFTDPKIGNYYMRFARDFFRYHDEVFCAAGKIILALQYENSILTGDTSNDNFTADLDLELVGGYSSLHVRRGDLQFKEVALNSSQWYENTKELWKPNEILYVATDERNNSFFDDFRKQHSGRLRFFDDYKALANLDNIDQTLYGMIDTIVASRGTVFAGTWFSTFSGYIVRLRGYYGFSKYFSYYSYLPRKFFMHEWMNVGEGSLYAREYPTAWTGIDGDEFIDNDDEETRPSSHGQNSSFPIIFPRAEMDKLKERMLKRPRMRNRHKGDAS